MVELREIGENNYKEVLALEVDPDQKSHVAPNVVSLAQAWVFRDVARPFAIYAGDTLVGFAMLEGDLEKPSYDIWRFMIDRHHQRKGYGRAAMERILAHFAAIGARE
ncbi:MAG: GNAT family N-acetyltransferase, partial [Clostridiaceae bacterium]|nr:GNAT family N-acetyltransferase [Clostridiaceae bacterium]